MALCSMIGVEHKAISNVTAERVRYPQGPSAGEAS